MSNNITVHMMVKNEDQWVRYSLLSILPYVDTILITDTGSTDHTLDAIKSINSPKIVLTQTQITKPSDVTNVRNQQLSETKTPWFWVVDGDELYPDETAQEVVQATKDNCEGIVVRRYDLLGDIYHRQQENVGTYQLFGKKGHLVTRLINRSKIKGLHYSGTYPNEGFYDDNNKSTRDRDPKNWYITKNYLFHAMYLKRSSLGSNLTMFNRQKYKIETGIKLETTIPRVFKNYPPLPWETNPKAKRSLSYELTASVLTPIKNLKRKFL